MANDKRLNPVSFPETAAKGYFVHARYQNEQLMTPAPQEFYVEIEIALAVGLSWLNDRFNIDPSDAGVRYRATARRVACAGDKNSAGCRGVAS